MKRPSLLYIALSFCLALLTFSCSSTKDGVVTNKEELHRAIAIAKPGDVITMADGAWKDIEIRFRASGTAEEKITLTAQTPGQVTIEGQSNLSLSGEHLEVSGLVFKNGYSPTSFVIAFRTADDELAYHSRVTNCVIDNFSNPERFESDIWVTMYGKNNRFDHNSLIGKRNLGVTMAVRLNTEESRENNHVIEYNYFGPRQNLGANGGETLRIGTSHYSLTDSKTIVRNNYFDRCDGEHEIISNKSGNNSFKSNVFDQCRGTLTMRHGKYTLVENNYFLGNRKPNTGGIRVINEYQTVKNNYMSGLTGYRFRGALVVMNGVPNSPINRYNQVVDSEISGNVLVDCDHVQLCAGSDEERSAVPVGTTMINNIFLSQTNPKPFTIYDDITGIEFADNLINKEAEPPLQTGFEKVSYEVQVNENGLKAPADRYLSQIGFGEPKLPVTKTDVGASYYQHDISEPTFRTGKSILVQAGTNTLLEALSNSSSGDVLLLENGARYLLTKDFVVPHLVTIKTPDGAKATIFSRKNTFFKIHNEGGLELENVRMSGAESPDMAGNTVVSTSKYSMNRNYKLFVRNCEIVDLDINHSFDFFRIYRSTMADTLLIENSTFKNITGSVATMAREVEDLGMYNVEYVLLHNNSFEQVQGAVANIYRGGTDESTFGPIAIVANNEFDEVGNGKRNKIGGSLYFHGVQNLKVQNNTWRNSAPLKLHLTNGEPVTQLEDLTYINTPKHESNSTAYSQQNIEVR
ncbi:polysaccharide lyase 6 family protein [Marinoscillum furvescens]|uniref:Poly(Beta-D-mannuronate) lyase n=1 Tax=Marinoscillum furvescens DSM 4134 TaxID=1122208 RepID=A0A3D9L2C7_MARFU|nr:polysaccharide lyase 6 family protein [Marinoscillum furvescens]RED96595.1 poly(beta-D-mannuronate) lyase [Marinoscillum furvescens DSM 4134]